MIFSKKTRPPASPARALSLPPDPEGDLPELRFALVRDSWSTVRITVHPDGKVLVKAPRRLRDGDLLRAVLRRRAWIQGKLDLFSSLPPPTAHAYLPGEIFFVQGRPYGLCYCPPAPPPGGDGGAEDRARRVRRVRRVRRIWAELRNSALEIRWQGGGEPNPQEARKAVLVWRKTLARAVLDPCLVRLHHLACRVLGDHLPLPPLRVRTLKRRWGSCSSRGEIGLATQLSALPPQLADYVILHELCHLRRFDHGRDFHSLLEKLVPDHRRLEEQLKAWSLLRVAD